MLVKESYNYKSCKEIRADINDSLSGLYSIQPVLGGKVITVYCEMAISNGKPLRYANCDGSKDNLFAFLPNHSELPPSDRIADNLIYERQGMAVNWRNTAVPPPSGRTMPNEFFFLTEVHIGGCGCYTSSDRWTDANGTAIGFR
ncbi:uncharacterized protein LOC110067403 [Orbicella faveolata]|uniref:uncharacterized protein LOC110067403 n=1 Tax=Orbicella faveolata TaxID=48498 RepID=UPI0009E5202F|nr:uncharacterized protein LOC110067403 [Orbicella faveolata]